jgi:hypothetical protein
MMCVGPAPGLLLGVASGVAQAAGQAQAANTNARMAVQQARLEHATQEREYVIESEASAKEANRAAQERDRAVAAAKVIGAEMGGTTKADRIAEQNRQGALSIANARDRVEAAGANYAIAGQQSTIKAENDIAANALNPMTTFLNIATSGLEGYKSWPGTATPTA